MNNAYLIKLEDINVSLQGQRILTGINWQLRKGEHWAVIGPNGSGKTTFLKLIRGDIWPDPQSKGRRIYNLNGVAEESPIDIHRKISMVSPENHDAYIRNNWDMDAEEVIYTGFFNTVWLQQKPDRKQMGYAAFVINTLGLNSLKHTGILAMSEGEARKIMIARALVSRPKILILDEFLSGLDTLSRRGITDLIGKIIHSGTQIIHAAHRAKDIFPSASHVVRLNRGVIISQGEKTDILDRKDLRTTLKKEALIPSRMNSRRTTRQAQDSTGKACRYLIEIKDADVYIDDKKILKKITWKIKYGENWIILGKNGAGKSTLLKLISGDLRPAAGGYIFRFGKGEKFSIRDLKKRIGLVSSSLQGSYDFNLTGEEVILSGFFSSMGLYHRVTGLQKKTAERWMRYFDAEAICKKTAMSMSYGELRKILIIRAMVNEPEMLILDEPFSGLDTPVRKDLINSIERVVKTGVSVIMATHHPDDFIPSITHVLALERGGVKMKGGKQKILEELQKK